MTSRTLTISSLEFIIAGQDIFTNIYQRLSSLTTSEIKGRSRESLCTGKEVASSPVSRIQFRLNLKSELKSRSK